MNGGRFTVEQQDKLFRESHGNTARGTRNGFARLNEVTVREIKRRVSLGQTQRSIAHDLSTSQGTVTNIVRARVWRHV